MQMSWGRTAILRWCVVPFILVSCTSSPQFADDERSGCASGQARPSCFYQEDPRHLSAKLLIFVHGVFDKQSTTWGDQASEAFWPKMILKDPRFAEGVDLYFMNYQVPYVQGAPNIHEIAGNELEKLERQGVFARYQEIHFIAHSLGGVVVKNILTRLNRGEDVQKLHKVTSVVYLATPAQGARGAEMGSWLSLNPQLDDTARKQLSTDVQRVEDQWGQLIEDRDRSKGEFPRAYCAYETSSAGSLVMVPGELAASRCDGASHPMPLNHMGMSVPTTMDHDPYLWTMAKIVEAGAVGAMRRKAAGLMEEADRLIVAGKHGEARKAFDDSRALYRKMADPQGEANALTGLGHVERKLGRSDQARSAYDEARSLYLAEGNRLGEANVLTGLGHVERKLGRNEQARSAYLEARSLYQAEGNRLGEANVLTGLGHAERKLGQNEQARSAYLEARSLYQAEGNRLGEANVLRGLGDVERKLGRNEQARSPYLEARSLYQGEGNRLGEANVLAGLGDVERKLGRNEQARSAYLEARSLYQGEGNRLGEANVLRGLGLIEAQTDRKAARQYLYQAALLYEQIELHDWKDLVLREANHLKPQKE